MNTNKDRTIISLSSENYNALHAMKAVKTISITDQLTQSIHAIHKAMRMEELRFSLMNMHPKKFPRVKTLNIKKSTTQQLRLLHLEIDKERNKVGRESLSIDDVIYVVIQFYHAILRDGAKDELTTLIAPRTAADHENEQFVISLLAAYEERIIERYKASMGITSDAPQSFL